MNIDEPNPPMNAKYWKRRYLIIENTLRNANAEIALLNEELKESEAAVWELMNELDKHNGIN